MLNFLLIFSTTLFFLFFLKYRTKNEKLKNDILLLKKNFKDEQIYTENLLQIELLFKKNINLIKNLININYENENLENYLSKISLFYKYLKYFGFSVINRSRNTILKDISKVNNLIYQKILFKLKDHTVNKENFENFLESTKIFK